MEVLGVRTQKELAKHLDISQSTVSSWRTNRKINIDDLVCFCPDMDWNYLIRGNTSFINCSENNQIIEDLRGQITKLQDENSKLNFMIDKLLSRISE